jgi:hypothetical protein
MSPPEQPVFTARRALWAVLLNFVMGALLAVMTIINIVRQIQEDGSLLASGFFAVLALFFLGNAWSQLRARAPLIEVGAAGLRLPGASEQIVPWTEIRQIAPARSLPGLSPSRVDFTVEPDTFARLKLGQRFMGDVIVKRIGMPNSFSVITPQLEENATAIFAAVKRYWPPERPREDQGGTDRADTANDHRG